MKKTMMHIYIDYELTANSSGTAIHLPNLLYPKDCTSSSSVKSSAKVTNYNEISIASAAGLLIK